MGLAPGWSCRRRRRSCPPPPRGGRARRAAAQSIIGRPVPASMWKRPLPAGPRSSAPSMHRMSRRGDPRRRPRAARAPRRRSAPTARVPQQLDAAGAQRAGDVAGVVAQQRHRAPAAAAGLQPEQVHDATPPRPQRLRSRPRPRPRPPHPRRRRTLQPPAHELRAQAHARQAELGGGARLVPAVADQAGVDDLRLQCLQRLRRSPSRPPSQDSEASSAAAPAACSTRGDRWAATGADLRRARSCAAPRCAARARCPASGRRTGARRSRRRALRRPARARRRCPAGSAARSRGCPSAARAAAARAR